jgi:hypothetical protein
LKKQISKKGLEKLEKFGAEDGRYKTAQCTGESFAKGYFFPRGVNAL